MVRCKVPLKNPQPDIGHFVGVVIGKVASDRPPLEEYLIDNVKADGKHSFQDSVLPIWKNKQFWGDRIALLGGIDAHRLATLDEAKRRHYVRDVIDRCLSGGLFAVGAGNSIFSYIPLKSYLVMIDEALR